MLKDEMGCIKSLNKININDSELVFVNMVTKAEKVLIHKNHGAEELFVNLYLSKNQFN